MNTYEIYRNEMLALAGIEPEYKNEYTPITMGKNNKPTKPMKIWANQFRRLNFRNQKELREINPENVSAMPIFFKNANDEFVAVENKRAIVGDISGKSYAVHSDKYEPVQHGIIVQAMADACNDTDVSVFGHLSDDGKGRFNGYGTFANPDFHINLGDMHDDPVMLGMRFFNSHLGDSKFGGEIFGIRAVCQNYMAWGEVLGNVSIMHFKSEEDVADELSKVIMGYVDQIDALKDRVHYIKDTDVGNVEQEAILWGIGLNPVQIENIMTHKTELNPEFKGSVWDIYNASTAFISYRVGGSHMENSNLRISDKIQQILVNNANLLIAQGEKRREKYYEEVPQTSRVIVKAVA